MEKIFDLIFEQVAEKYEEFTAEVRYDIFWNDFEINKKFEINQDGEEDYFKIYSPNHGWSDNYYDGWCYDKENKETELEQLFVDSVNAAENWDTISEWVWASENGEINTFEIGNECYREFEHLETDEEPACFEVKMKVTFSFEDSEGNLIEI